MGKFVDGFVSCDNDIITRHFFCGKAKYLAKAF